MESKVVWHLRSCMLWPLSLLQGLSLTVSTYLIPTKLDPSLFPNYSLCFLISRPLLMLSPPPGMSYSTSIGLNTTVQLKCSTLYEKLSLPSLLHESFPLDTHGIFFVQLYYSQPVLFISTLDLTSSKLLAS